jgi:hypothetical protein
MALLYRVVAFQKPCGPWRPKQRQAQMDAIHQGWGEYDADGQFWLNAPARLEWMREDEIKLAVGARLASGTGSRALQSR